MNVTHIELRQFTVHDQLTLALPQRGVLLVTGRNGAGKSSLVEGVAWAGWGRTLRGSVPWRETTKPPCRALIRTPELAIERQRFGAKTVLEWADAAREEFDTQWPTATKAQEALDARIPAFDVWRRTSVFSSADAAHFTQSTDGERKRFLEGVLGLTRFDSAHEAARAAATAAGRACSQAEREADKALALLGAAKDGLDRARTALHAFVHVGEPAVPTGATTQAMEPLLATAERELAQARTRMREADRAGSEHAAAARAARDTLTRLHSATTCPLCTQRIPPELLSTITRSAATADATAAAARAAAATAVGGTEALIVELEDEVATLRQRITARRQVDSVYERQLQAHRLAGTALDSLRRAAEHAQTLHSDRMVAHHAAVGVTKSAEADLAEANAVEEVLGLRGVRAHLLGAALAGLGEAANGWLARLGLAGLSVSLRPYSEKKTGGVADAISIEVAGAGGGQGYKGASGGERRRLDVALLLALAEVAGAARGRPPGTLWFDEVFDCLDESGTEAVAAALQGLAAERCVVVITHSKMLAECLPGAARLELP